MALKIWKLQVSALVAVSVLIGATACGGSSDVSGGTATPSPSTSPPSTPVDLRSMSPQDLDPSTYESLSARDYALLVKDLDSNIGRKIVVYGVVTQFDAATGKAQLRANTGAQPDDYLQYTIIDTLDPSILANVVRRDAVTMWCQVKGSATYGPTFGRHMTIPEFWVYIIRDAGKSPIP
jgi:hypothetical protein